MSSWLRFRLVLLAGISCLLTALVLYVILLEGFWWIQALAAVGAVLAAVALVRLRHGLVRGFRGRRGEVAAFALGMIGIAVAVGYLSVQHPWRYDMTTAGLYSLSSQTETMLARLNKPVRITFFHDPKMRETVELYWLMAQKSDRISLVLHDPMLNPAEARLHGVRFAGTAVMESEDRRIQVHGHREADLANGILRVSQGAKQTICFLEGHREADPFSIEAHDHIEGTAGGSDGHEHGMGSDYVLHERHGMAKARHSLETLNYTVTKLSLVKGGGGLSACAVLVVAGPKIKLLQLEVDAIQAYLAAGGDALFMLEPFIESGLEPVVEGYGVKLDNTLVIDEASHYWTDPSAPAVTSYNHHQIAADLPLTFFPGVRSLSPTSQRMAGTAAMPIANSSTNSFGETSRGQASFDADEDRRGPLSLVVVSNRRPPNEGDVEISQLGPQREGSVSSVAATSAGLPVTARSRVIVIGDSDFATNSFFHFLGNGDLFMNAVNYLAAQENLIGIEPQTYDLPRLSITNRQIKATFVIAILLIPDVLLFAGIVIWWRQR